MPSLSRGRSAHLLSLPSRPMSHAALLQPLPARLACHRGHIPLPAGHLFSTLASLRASVKVVNRPPLPSKPTKSSSSSSSSDKAIPSTTTRPLPPSPPYAALLASKSTPTLLYEAPNQFWFTLSAFNAGAFCIGYVGVQYYTIFVNTPPGLDWWVPKAYAVVCAFMATIGFYWMRWPSRIVRAISAVPVSLAGAGKINTSTLQLEVATKRWVPLLPLKKTRYNLEDVHVPAKVAALVYAASGNARLERLSPRDQLLHAKMEEERKAKARQYELDHIMTAPFRHFGRGMKAAFGGMARALTREGFAKIRMGKSKELKLDVKGGWFLDEGKALDRLIHARPDDK